MAEFTNVPLQTVAENANVLFADNPVRSIGVGHRQGSGLVELHGFRRQCPTRYKVSFGANIGIPTGGTVEPISIAIAIGGEALGSATAIVTPAAVEDLNNIHVEASILVNPGCCVDISIRNTSTQPILVQNANLIAEIHDGGGVY